MTTIYMLLTAYLLGSIPFGLLLTKAAGHGDIRNIGSGNIGATNVLRTGNKKLAALTLFLDALKGVLAIVAALLWLIAGAALEWPFDKASYLPAAGIAALLGHMFPIWLKFKGGKGVATVLGVWVALAPPVFLTMIVAWAAGAKVTRKSSAGALAMMAVCPVAVYFLDAKLLPAALIMFALVVLKHHSNIQRLLDGTEPTIGKKK